MSGDIKMDVITVNGIQYAPVNSVASLVDEEGRRPVLVTTEFRGVFFGYTDDTTCDEITLYNARNCIYWHSSVGGVFGLASSGPNTNCRIGETVSELELRKITSVTEVTTTAAKAWANAKTYVG